MLARSITFGPVIRDMLHLIANIISTYSAPGEGTRQNILNTAELMRMACVTMNRSSRLRQNLDELRVRKGVGDSDTLVFLMTTKLLWGIFAVGFVCYLLSG